VDQLSRVEFQSFGPVEVRIEQAHTNVRFGSKPEKLNASKWLPLCLRQQTLRNPVGIGGKTAQISQGRHRFGRAGGKG
jgi:hypothetical protein